MESGKPKFFASGITFPVTGQHADVSVPAGSGACDGTVLVEGTGVKPHVTLVEVRVLVTAGWFPNPIPASTVQSGGTPVTLNGNDWSEAVAGAVCQGGACGGDGKNTVAAQLLWEDNSSGMPVQTWESVPDVQFIGDCV